jgi:hypothetical protein
MVDSRHSLNYLLLHKHCMNCCKSITYIEINVKIPLKERFIDHKHEADIDSFHNFWFVTTTYILWQGNFEKLNIFLYK